MSSELLYLLWFTCKQILYHVIQGDRNSLIRYTRLCNFSYQKILWYFSTDIDPQFLVVRFYWRNLQSRLLFCTYCIIPLHKYRWLLPFKRFDSPDDLRKALCFNFFKLNRIIILIIFFTGGLPFRMTEVLGLQFNDTKRNIYFREGKMVCTYTYNKTDNITNSAKLYQEGIQLLFQRYYFCI